MWNFFEQPWTLLGAAVIVLLGVLTFRSVWADKQRWWQWLIPLGVAALAFGLDFGVTTDLEKVNRAIAAGIKAGECEDLVAIGRLIAADYEDSYHKSKQALLDHCRARLTPPAISRIRKVGRPKVQPAPSQATAILTMWITFEKESYWAQSYKPNALVVMQLHFRKQPNKTWLLNRAEVLEVDKMPVNWGSAQLAAPDPSDTQPTWMEHRLPVSSVTGPCAWRSVARPRIPWRPGSSLRRPSSSA